jgi:GH15 family glucan-1,4-alpha-glucosidase
MKAAIIGNCQYSALIEEGNVVWMCWPRFDSSFIFGSLLDDQRGGEFSIKPAANDYTVNQQYLTNTNILRTTFKTADGEFEVIDFAPRFFQHDRYFRPTTLMRILVPIQGAPMIKIVCRPRSEYGARELKIATGSNHLSFEGADAPIRLTTDLSLTHINEARPFSLSKRSHLVLTWGRPFEAPIESTCEDFLTRTLSYWQRWVKHCHLPAFRPKEVIRSALVLKLHQFEDTGGIIAATTTSIPEAPGSTRNWDYRYCWVRDAYFTVQALRRLSHFEEMEGFARFLRDIIRSSDHGLQPLYSISGESELVEKEISALAGYLGHPPVRIGNEAYKQIQHDIYGQALMALMPLFTDLRFANGTDVHSIDVVEKLFASIEETLDSSDAGIWEFRGVLRVHTFTKLMHWAGARAAVEIAANNSLDDLGKRAKNLQNAAGSWIEKYGWNKSLQAMQLSKDDNNLDASLLLAINMGYLSATDPRARTMIEAISEQLGTSSGLIRRYIFDDGMGPATTCFTVCSFWLAEALARIGEVEKAREVFDAVLKHANHVGLLSEDIDTATGTLWGNFPQTYSHVGLINAAFAISKDARDW